MATIVLLLLSFMQGITLRGTVWEGGDKPAAGATVILIGQSGSLNTLSAADGTFRFTLKGPGYYELNAVRGSTSGHPSTMFVGQDMDGIGILLRAAVNPFVLGSVKVEGGEELPAPLPKIVIKYPSGTVFSRVDITARGLFFCAVTPSEFSIALENVNDPYFVKSIMNGKQDVTKAPVQLAEHNATNIEITLGIRK
jgi:hypothetical protein